MNEEPRDEDEEPPSHAEVARELRALMTRGLPATRPNDVASLLELHAVRALALVDLPSSRLAALRERIDELSRGTRDELLRRLAPYAFGTYSTDNLPLETRLQHAEQRGIGRGPQSLRKKYLRLLANDFADRLLWLEHRLRYNRWLDRPGDDAIHDETLRQYDFYTAMAFWLNGAALDVHAALEDQAEECETGFSSYAGSALWRWTKFLRVSHRHQETFLGSWSLAANAEADVDTAIQAAWDAEALPPILPRDRSWLRVELRVSFYEELDSFIRQIEGQPVGGAITQRWTDWLRSCSCGGREVDDDCTVHRFTAASETFIAIMERAIASSNRTDRAARFQTLPDVYES